MAKATTYGDTIITDICEDCRYSQIDDSNKGNIRIYCEDKDKTYYWGQRIQCDSFTRKK